MPRKSMESLTETMFYILMAFRRGPKCGADVADYVERRTGGRLLIGPATLYTVLAKFEKEKYIQELETQEGGRKRTYEITAKGSQAYDVELERLRLCVRDGERAAEEREEAGEYGRA